MQNAEKFSINDVVYFQKLSKKENFRISWKMLDYCPYSCSYCYMSDAVKKARLEKNIPSQTSLEEKSEKINLYINKYIPKNKEIFLHLIGGEVTYYNLIPILNKIERLNMVIIATNLYRDFQYYKELKNYSNTRKIKLKIIASFHLEMLKTDEDRWAFIKKVKDLNAQIKVVIDSKNLKIYKPYLEYCKNNNIYIELTIKRIKGNSFKFFSKENQFYIDSLREYQYRLKEYKYYRVHLKNNKYIDFTSNIAMLNNCKEGLLNLTGFYCNAGQNNLRITQSGILLKAACHLCWACMKLGDILNENSWIDPKKLKPIICNCYFPENDLEKFQGCTGFGNTSMWRPGFSIEKNVYRIENVNIPNYYEIFKKDPFLKNLTKDLKKEFLYD